MQKYRKILILSLKIGIGSSLALYIAQYLGLNYAVSAGTITLLTLLNSKWETVKLSLWRLVTFAMTVFFARQILLYVDSVWLAYGLLLTVTVFIAELLGWRATLSVNGVIAAHFVADHNFSAEAIRNELLLVLIGITLAIFLNLFHANSSHKKYIIANMRSVEERLRSVIKAVAAYLLGEETDDERRRATDEKTSDEVSGAEQTIWREISDLERDIQDCIKEAYEYKGNTFQSHSGYYISYFEMRHDQCQILYNLHNEMKKIRTMPEAAGLVAEYLRYLGDYVTEFNCPKEQLDRLEQLVKSFNEDRLPKTREEFESRALVYHVLMDIEDFLKDKMRFVRELDDTQKKIYWKGQPEGQSEAWNEARAEDEKLTVVENKKIE